MPKGNTGNSVPSETPRTSRRIQGLAPEATPSAGHKEPRRLFEEPQRSTSTEWKISKSSRRKQRKLEKSATLNMETKPAMMMSNEQFEQLIQRLINTGVNDQPPANVEVRQPPGNFAKCTARFTGNREEDVGAFIDAITTFKDCANVSDDNAIKGLPMLLTDFAATWWKGIKESTANWKAALDSLRHTFGPNKPPHRIYRELFSNEQDDMSTDIFVSRARALFAQLPADDLSEKVQIDMVYGLLSQYIRKEVPRDKVNNFRELLDKARSVEDFIINASNSVNTIATTNARSAPSLPPKRTIVKMRPKCTFCHYFGHTVEECKRIRRKCEEDAAVPPQAKTELFAPIESQRPTGNSAGAIPRFNPVTCFGCGAPGVFRKDCPNCNSVKKARASPVEFSSLELGANSQKSRSRPIMHVDILGHHGTGLLDTAAERSIAGYKLYQLLLKENCNFHRSAISATLADGSCRPREILTTTVDVKLEGRTIPTTFMIFPEARDNSTLFGMDFIEDGCIVPNVAQRTWSFANNDGLHELYFEDARQPMNSVRINSVLMLRSDEGDTLAEDEKVKLENLLENNLDIFGPGGGPTPFAEHAIDTGDHSPISVPPYRMTAQKKDILRGELDAMLENDVIEECESPWAAPVVLVPKKDSTFRVCVDYRCLNAVTKNDPYPLPRLDELLHLSKRTLFMTTLDLRSGYWQVTVRGSDRDKTAFTTPFGNFRFKRMPFGLKNAGATFQRMMDRLRTGLKDVVVFAYLDDLVVISTDFEGHLQDLEKVFSRLRKFELRVNRKKCTFVRSEIKFLGHLITADGIRADPDKVSAVADTKPPKNVKHLMTFLQTCSWFRRFVPRFSDVARPLSNLMKKNVQWEWTDTQQRAFDELKGALVSAPILRQADENLPYAIRTDASNYALGAVLLQGEGPDERPVEYASRLLTPAERNYSTTEREALAVVWAVNKFRGYVEDAEITVSTDHQALRWLMSLKSPTGRLARWALALQPYKLKIEYIPGKSNVVADSLSRPSCSAEEEEVCDLCTIAVDLPARSANTLRDEQLSDPEVKRIVDSFEQPDHAELSNWMTRGYILSEGVLYRYVPEEDSEDAQLVVPQCARKRIMIEYHDAPTAGHYGAERTLRRISSKYYWPGMRRFVAAYVKDCIPCQRYKATNTKPSGLLRTPAACRRFETLAMDLVGPFPMTSEGYRWIFIVEDVATKWVELFPLHMATAEACSRKLIDEIILRYGTPRRIISDNGPQFVGAVMQQVSLCLGFDQALTPVYHPEANPVERKNRDLKVQLAILSENDHSDWAVNLPAIRYAMNSSFTRSTGQTPAFLMFSRELRSPDDVQRDLRPIVLGENFVSEITPYLLKIADIMKDVRETHEEQQDHAKRYADLKRVPAPTYRPGDLVLVRTHVLSNAASGVTSKLSPKRDGPYEVLAKKSETTYQIANIGSRTPLATYHAKDLTPFRRHEEESTPEPVRPLRRRGRPKKNPTTISETISGSRTRTSLRSRGGVCKTSSSRLPRQ